MGEHPSLGAGEIGQVIDVGPRREIRRRRHARPVTFQQPQPHRKTHRAILAAVGRWNRGQRPARRREIALRSRHDHHLVENRAREGFDRQRGVEARQCAVRVFGVIKVKQPEVVVRERIVREQPHGFESHRLSLVVAALAEQRSAQ